MKEKYIIPKNNKVYCDFCKKEYYVNTQTYNCINNKKTKTHCCSKECTDKLKVILSEEERKKFPFLKCDSCGIEFQVRPFEYKKKKKNLFIACSRNCANKLLGDKHKEDAQRRHVEKWNKLNCQYCGKEYSVDKTAEKMSKYCCRQCKDLAKTKNSLMALKCEHCGEIFFKAKGYVTFWGEIKYYSEECRLLSRPQKVNKKCIMCNKDYLVSNNRKNISICCSKYCLHKWLSEVYTKSPEVKNKLRERGIRSQLNQKPSFTLPEKIVFEYLTNNKIDFIFQYSVGDILLVDFFLPEYNCCLEVYGDYWHSNPIKYGEDKKQLNDVQKRIKQKDIRRYKVLTNNYGFYFYSLWETDIKNNLEISMNKFFEYINSKIRNEQVVV
jgi:G:T-mismatch repair DNA endonuclease (very short patch repair protein)